MKKLIMTASKMLTVPTMLAALPACELATPHSRWSPIALDEQIYLAIFNCARSKYPPQAARDGVSGIVTVELVY